MNHHHPRYQQNHGEDRQRKNKILQGTDLKVERQGTAAYYEHSKSVFPGIGCYPSRVEMVYSRRTDQESSWVLHRTHTCDQGNQVVVLLVGADSFRQSQGMR